MKRTFLGFIFLFILLTQINTLKTASASMTFDENVLARLGVSEILLYLKKVDAAFDYSDAQKATKYLWGYVPVDRNPSAQMELRWNTLEESEKRRLKVRWYREHFHELKYTEVRRYVNIDYLIDRAEAEFRKNPLRQGKSDAKLIKKPKKDKFGKKVVRKKPKKSVKKKPDKKHEKVAQTNPPTPVPTPFVKDPYKLVVDTSPVVKSPPGEILNKLPWYGLPNKLNNDN